ncbi:cytochrome ubiquinol oxidase subunit I [Novipirellula artificiosorum]|uniref:Cytochrome bd-I ubiquinol oxidase subunit 1 n=1 Tax=Novipirellula artificiosorum TaxID=2528016 RepID=A0A5C6D572_9BACT|nr:cytochrome ubiquinol oxidase subunit I [Novipirellula artificiosorum]TWU32000.1 Cytochrome bd-I ubiquinol oxidase subunit 1 [Novipirellula artificiosorum]
MEFDLVFLSRLQFALTIMFHYLFPPLTIGLGVVLVYLGAMSLRTGDAAYRQAQKFWTRVFGLNFAIGVASGIVMEFQFGTNWATYSRFVGDVFGSALAAEGIFAFFLESGFLAVLIFGWNRVGPKMHFFSTCMVAMGSIFSSVWIVVANSWQQTPSGSAIVPMTRQVLGDNGQPLLDANGEVLTQPWVIDGVPVMRAEITDFWEMVFNPSTVHRLTHVLLGCLVMGAFFVLSISAWYILKNKHVDFAKRSFTGALVLAAISSIAIALSGHRQAQNVYEYQPAKLAAFEGHFDSEGAADLTLFGIPDAEEEAVQMRIAIPGALSFMVHDDLSFSEPVIGLDKIRPEDRPPLWIPFLSWRLMVGAGTFFIALTLLSCALLWRGTLFEHRWLMWIYVGNVLLAVMANQVGWVAAEVGRQPWIVHPSIVRNDAGEPVLDAQGFIQYERVTATLPDGSNDQRFAGLRTDDGVSKAVEAEQVAASIVMFLFIYLLLGAVWLFVLNKKIQTGPDPPDSGFGTSSATSLLQLGARRTAEQRMAEAGTEPQVIANNEVSP